MNNEQLKADKTRVLAELNFIKAEYEADPSNVVNNLFDFGYYVEQSGKVTIKTPGGQFSFMVSDYDRIIELVEAHYPEDLEQTFTNSCVDNEDEVHTAIQNARHNLKTAIASGNEGLVILFMSELDKANARKEALIYV